MHGTGDLFQPFIEALRGRFPTKTVAYPRAGPQTYEHLETLVVAALPKEGCVVVLGESFSGPIAVRLAAARPHRVAGVVLCCTFLRNPRPQLRWLGPFLSLPLPVPPLSMLNPFLLGRHATHSLSQMLRQALSHISPVVLRARLKAVLTVDVRAQALTITVPVLYLRATDDRLVTHAAAIEAGQTLADMAVQSFAAPHCLLQTISEKAADAVAEFIQMVSDSKEHKARA